MDILYTLTNWGDWFEANILDGLLPFLFAPIQAFILWTGDSQGLLQVIIGFLNIFSP